MEIYHFLLLKIILFLWSVAGLLCATLKQVYLWVAGKSMDDGLRLQAFLILTAMLYISLASYREPGPFEQGFWGILMWLNP